jgi:purine-cytosine permease-like protein
MTIPNGGEIYSSNGIGLLATVLEPWGGFGKFLLVILSLSVIADNVPNTYSAALSIQALAPAFQLIPRAVSSSRPPSRAALGASTSAAC